MYEVKATRSKTDAANVTETATSHAEAIVVMIRLMKDFRTVEIAKKSNLGFRQTSVVR
jgi:hypothetical protein